jgi:hypothetical protein
VFGVLDWIMARQVHEYLDTAGRPIGEGHAAAIQHVHTEMQPCPYAGSRHHHDKPMNVSALRNILPVWGDILALLSWLGQRYRARHGKEVTTFDDLALVTSAGVFLADFLVLRRHRPLRSGEIPLLISGLYKVCLGFQLAAFFGLMRERLRAEEPIPLPDAARFYDHIEAQELLIGEAEVCAGPPAMIREAYDAMVGRQAIAQEALPPDCTRLDIAWAPFDTFSDHAADTWNDLVMLVIQTPRYCPQLAAPRLPPEVQQRLNTCLQRRAAELLEGQKGLVIDLARGAQESCGGPSAGQPEAPGGPVPSPGSSPGSLAAVVLAWLNEVAGADMRTYGPVVASELQTQLAPYDAYEATVLAGINGHVNCLMDALGLGRAGAALTASALSHVCGRTLRDWGNTS